MINNVSTVYFYCFYSQQEEKRHTHRSYQSSIINIPPLFKVTLHWTLLIFTGFYWFKRTCYLLIFIGLYWILLVYSVLV